MKKILASLLLTARSSTLAAPTITQLLLVNGNTGETQPADGATLPAKTLCHIRAQVNAETNSVAFQFSPGTRHVKDVSGGIAQSAGGPGLVGQHNVAAIPYAARRGTGAEGPQVTATYTIAASGSPSFRRSARPTQALTSTPTPTVTPTRSNFRVAAQSGGIADKYPGDEGIEKDLDVLMADDFESYESASELPGPKWSGATTRQGNLRIATEPINVYAGKKALEMKLPISTSETLNTLAKRFDTADEQPVLYIRTYTKFDPGFDVKTSSHNGIRISAHYPGGSGIQSPADGSGWFAFSCQNNQARVVPHYPNEQQPGYGEIYAYWPKQKSAYGDHWYPDGWVKPGGNSLWLRYPSQYPDFKVMPNWQAPRGEWFCYELMVKANTIGKNDGEVAFWVNGKLTGRFPNLFLRSLDSIKIDYARLTLHAANNRDRVQYKWYDNVVIAKKYIGPMKPKPSPMPSP